MSHDDFYVRPMEPNEWGQVAAVIHDSTNAWYTGRSLPAIFNHGTSSCELFCQVYEGLDPGCCQVAEDCHTGRIAGSCFYHPRSTHVSLGIMNVHPDCFGRGVARLLLKSITDIADELGLPTRLVSSAINLDSYSLYSRGGFVPKDIYQDVLFSVPADGLTCDPPARAEEVREITADDIPAMVALEKEVAGIEREKDYRYFVANELDVWHGSVLTDGSGEIRGFLHSIRHLASNMVGPGVMKDDEAALALIWAELKQHQDNMAVVLTPAARPDVVHALYAWGGRNCELHVSQVRGKSSPVTSGLVIPTFMPETG